MNIPSKENPDDRPQPPQRMNSEERSNEDAAQLIAAHDANPPLGPWDECDGCHVDYVRSLLARIAAVEAAADEVHGHGADDERAEVERLRGIISRIAVLAASPTPTGPEPAKCEHRQGGPHLYFCGGDRCPTHDCPGPATPTEPTKETP